MADLTCYALCDKKLDSGHKALTVMNLLLVSVNAKAVQLNFTINYFFSLLYDNNNIILLQTTTNNNNYNNNNIQNNPHNPKDN